MMGLNPVLLVSDLDGTALNPDESVPDSWHSLAAAVRRSEGVVVVATARPPQGVVTLLGDSFDYAVCLDGAITVASTQEGKDCRVIGEQAFTESTARHAYEMFAGGDPDALFVFAGQALDFAIACVDSPGPWHPGLDALRREYADGREIHELKSERDSSALDSFIRECRSLSFFNAADTIDGVFGRVSSVNLPPSVRIERYQETRGTSQNLEWIDLLPAELSKASALTHLCVEALGDLPLVVLGNGINDIPMLRLADTAIGPIDVADAVEPELGICIQEPCGERFLTAVLSILEEETA